MNKSKLNNQELIQSVKSIERKLKIKGGNSSFNLFYEKRQRAAKILDVIIENEKDAMIINEARKNYIVNLVTGMEVLFKRLIIECKDVWVKEGFESLLTEKVSLNDAFELFKVSGVSRENLLAHASSFQNLDSIQKVFSALTGNDFLKTVGNSSFGINGVESFGDEFRWMKTTFDKKFPNWRKDIISLYELRHRIIHEDDNTPIKKTLIGEYTALVDNFLLSVWLPVIRKQNNIEEID